MIHRIHPTPFRSSLYAFCLCLPVCVLCGCSSPLSFHTSSDQLSFGEYTDQLFTEEVKANTLSMHYILADPAKYGIADYEVSLGHLNEDSYEASICGLENMTSVLENYDTDKLSLTEQLTRDILADYAVHEADLADYYLYQEPLRPQTGFAAEYPVLLTEYQFRTEQDVKDYLALLSSTSAYFDELLAFEEAKSAEGLFMSDTSADAIISGCNALTAPCDEHYLITTFNDKMNTMSGLSPDKKTLYKDKNAQIVQEKLLPAYDGLSDGIAHLKGTGTNEHGLSHYPDGTDYYSRLVYASTGSSHSLPELEQMAEAKRMDDLLIIADLLEKNPALAKENIASSCVFSDPCDTLHYLSDQIADLFPSMPDTGFTVDYVDPCMQESMAPAFYLTAPIDDTSHNSIYVNPACNTDDLKLFTTLAHEGFPGHLYQTVYTAGSGLAPIRSLLNYPGYVEGWATYVELLSYSYAGLSPDAASLFAHHQSAILSLYASADMGIHAKGWTYRDTFDFFKDYGITDAATVAEIYNYIVEEPAHYLKYYVGYLEFLDLKDYAQKKYGDTYSDIAFHRTILRIGPAPFAIVKKYLPLYWSEKD